MEGYLEQSDSLDWRQFLVAVRRLADNLSYGTDKSPFLGSGIEYVQSRPYQWGDPVRSIDWRVTARTGRLFVKEYEAPKRLPCYLLIDTSASMAVTSQPRSKYATAVQIAGGIAFACLDRISPVGVVGTGERDFRVEPSLGRDRVMQWMHDLRRYRFDEATTLSRRIVELGATLTSRALVIVLSDFHDDRALPALKRMSQLHDCAVLLFRDPSERSLRGGGLFRAREAETGEAFVTHGRRHWVSDDELRRQLTRAGIDQLTIETDQPFRTKLRHFFKARDLLSKGAR